MFSCSGPTGNFVAKVGIASGFSLPSYTGVIMWLFKNNVLSTTAFIAVVSTDLSFANVPCMFSEFISSLPAVFSICYLVSLSYTCNLVLLA